MSDRGRVPVNGRPLRFRDLPRERKVDLVIRTKCVYCGAPIRGEHAKRGACRAHSDLPGLEPL